MSENSLVPAHRCDLSLLCLLDVGTFASFHPATGATGFSLAMVQRFWAAGKTSLPWTPQGLGNRKSQTLCAQRHLWEAFCRDRHDDLILPLDQKARFFDLHRFDPEKAEVKIDLHPDVGVAPGIAGLVPSYTDMRFADRSGPISAAWTSLLVLEATHDVIGCRNIAEPGGLYLTFNARQHRSACHLVSPIPRMRALPRIHAQ